MQFADFSYLTGTDNDGDGRSVLPVDLDGDGMQDLVVRQAGGGPLIVYRNRFPKEHWLKISLRGNKSNGLGIGARITAEVGPQKIVRELFPHNTYWSVLPNHVYFGLGEHRSIDKLTVRWPSGLRQVIRDVTVDRHLYVEEPSN